MGPLSFCAAVPASLAARRRRQMGRSRKWSAVFDPSSSFASALGDDLTGAIAPAAWRYSPRSFALLSVLRVAFPVFVRNYLRWSRPRVQIAKAAITGEYVTILVTCLECFVLAVPVHVAFSKADDCAPGGITISSAGRASEPRCRRKSSNTKCQFR